MDLGLNRVKEGPTVVNSQTATYELIDVGGGKKLERFGECLVARPCPVSEAPERSVAAWRRIDLEFVRQSVSDPNARGRWLTHRPPPPTWQLRSGPLVLNLQPTPFGHLGAFPEQLANWDWIRQMSGPLAGMRAINLFAHTGGTTLALASCGAQVVHLDSSRSAVNWARRNSVDSRLDQAPIRWIVDDALTFLEREVRRGRRYEIVVADPPAFGHGPKRQGWKFDRDLNRLLALLAQLTAGRPRLVLFTGHSAGCDAGELLARTRSHFPELADDRWESGQMTLTSRTEKQLPAGYFVRFVNRPNL